MANHASILAWRIMWSVRKAKSYDRKMRTPRLDGIQYVTGEEERAMTNSSRKNEEAG